MSHQPTRSNDTAARVALTQSPIQPRTHHTDPTTAQPMNSSHSLENSTGQHGTPRSPTLTTEGSVRNSSRPMGLGSEEPSVADFSGDDERGQQGDFGREEVDSTQTMYTPASQTSPSVLGTGAAAGVGSASTRATDAHQGQVSTAASWPAPVSHSARLPLPNRAGVAAAVASYSDPLSGLGSASSTAGNSQQQQQRGIHDPSSRQSVDSSAFLSADGVAPTLPRPVPRNSNSPVRPFHEGQQRERQLQRHREDESMRSQQQTERQVRYGTQRQNPPVCAGATTSSQDWVRLNVGGRAFVSTFATLCSDPNSILAQICEPLLRSRRLRESDKEGMELDTVAGVGEGLRGRRRRGPVVQQGQSLPRATDAAPTGVRASLTGDSASGGASPQVSSSPTLPNDLLTTGSTLGRDRGEAGGADGADPLPARHADSYSTATPRAEATAASHDAGGGELPNPGGEDPLTLVPLDMDEHNSILLDLDPDYFAPILNYLRHRAVIIPPSLSARGVLAVAEYLNVQGMVRQLAPERRVRRQVLSSWGSGGSGELGTQRFMDSEVPTPVQVVPFGVKVVHMALGANYSCALSDDGNIYTFGNGDWGQLGLGSPKDLDVHPTDKSAVVVVPRRIPLFERHRALHVSAGYAFAMAIIDDHHVYFWGNNNHGQSGLGPRYFDYNMRKIDEPKLVETLEGKRIVQIGCGSFFSLALSEDGTLYSWGLIECLGLGPPDEVRRRYQDTNILGESLSNEKRGVIVTPQAVNIRHQGGHRIVRIHAGQWHSGAINSAGELFTWGVGYQGRLGHGTKEPAYVPTKVRGALAGHRVVDVACGSFHTVALTDRGAVFCWGDNASGQCGTSATHTEAVTSPYRVVGLEFIAGGVAKGISCGRQHTVVVMEGPQPGCQGPCCQLDYRGRPYHAHAQVYTFGESARSGAGGSGNTTTTAAAAAAGNHGPGSGNMNNTGNHGVVGNGSLATGSSAASGVMGPGNRGGRGAGLMDSYGGAGTGGRTCSQYQLVPGLERMNVVGVVSGLHHTFVYAEEIEYDPQQATGGGGGSGSGGYGEEAEVAAFVGLGNAGYPGVFGFGSDTGVAAAVAGGYGFFNGGARDAQRQWQSAQLGWGGRGPGASASPFARH